MFHQSQNNKSIALSQSFESTGVIDGSLYETAPTNLLDSEPRIKNLIIKNLDISSSERVPYHSMQYEVASFSIQAYPESENSGDLGFVSAHFEPDNIIEIYFPIMGDTKVSLVGRKDPLSIPKVLPSIDLSDAGLMKGEFLKADLLAGLSFKLQFSKHGFSCLVSKLNQTKTRDVKPVLLPANVFHQTQATKKGAVFLALKIKPVVNGKH